MKREELKPRKQKLQIVLDLDLTLVFCTKKKPDTSANHDDDYKMLYVGDIFQYLTDREFRIRNLVGKYMSIDGPI